MFLHTPKHGLKIGNRKDPFFKKNKEEKIWLHSIDRKRWLLAQAAGWVYLKNGFQVKNEPKTVFDDHNVSDGTSSLRF